MPIYYSASTNGFYDDAIHETRPSDAVEITREAHEALLDGQTAGRPIAADAGGRPVNSETPNFAIHWDARAARELAKSDVTVLRCIESGKAIPPEWSEYRSALREIAQGKAVVRLPAAPPHP